MKVGMKSPLTTSSSTFPSKMTSSSSRRMSSSSCDTSSSSLSPSSLKSRKSLTLWLMTLTILVIIGIISVAFVLMYLLVNANNNLESIQAAESNNILMRHEKVRISEKDAEKEGIKRRSKRSPLVSSSSSFVEGSTGGAKLMYLRRYEDDFNEIHDGTCRKRTLSMCNGQVPFNSTTYPNFIGDDNEVEASRSLPYFNYIAKSRCNRRIKQLLCSFLEPACDGGRPIPPCKKFCRIALEGCTEFIPQTLELSAAFDCRRYPDSSDPRVCVNLAMGHKCASDEFQCPDRSCIPRHWVCDGVRDCMFAADEANCNTVACSSEEFQCDRKCVPASWRCDGDRDCLDGTDELSCSYRPGCGPDRFKCADGFGCIPKRWVCDGKAECRDGSDEIGCSQKDCTRGDFKCDNGICIPNIWVCDGQDDCKDNSDERSCSGNPFATYVSHSVPAAIVNPPPPVTAALRSSDSHHNQHQQHQHNHHPSSSSSSSQSSSSQSQSAQSRGEAMAAAASYQMASYTLPPQQPQQQQQQHHVQQQQQQPQPRQQTQQPVYFQATNYYTRQPVYSSPPIQSRSSHGHTTYTTSYTPSISSYRPSYNSVNPLFGPNHVYRYFFKR